MTLIERLASLSANVVLIEDETRRLTAGEVVARAARPADELAGARVALMTADPILGLEALALLDGRADAVLLLTATLDAETAAALIERAGCTALVSDRIDVPVGEAVAVVADVDALAAAVASGAGPAGETRWLMTTSGTTGEPKIVSHTLASLARTTRTGAWRDGRPVWAMLYDFTRFAGMQVFLQSVLSGARLVVADLDRPLDDRLAGFAEAGVTHVSATPTLWRKILMTPSATRLAPRQITLGGEVADDRILAALRQTWPEARIVHIFASTEAGVGFSVTDGRAGFPRAYLGSAPAGVGIRVDGDRLLVRNPLVAGAYVGASESFADAEGWVATGDVVEIDGDRVRFLGRASGLINVGGDKVLPEEVERVLLDHPGVAAARVFAKRNPITGALVAAEVVPDTTPADNAAFVAELRAFAAERLPPYKVPALLRVVAQLATNAAGKIVRSNR